MAKLKDGSTINKSSGEEEIATKNDIEESHGNFIADTNTDEDSPLTRYRRLDETLLAFLATGAGGTGLKLNLFNHDNEWTGAVTVDEDGTIKQNGQEIGGGGTGVTYGSNSNGSWLRFDNGIQVCWNSQDHGTHTIDGEWAGGGFYGRLLNNIQNFPQSFTSPPLVIKDVTSTNGTIIPATVNPVPTTTNPGAFEANRPTIATVNNLTTHYIAIGLWQ